MSRSRRVRRQFVRFVTVVVAFALLVIGLEGQAPAVAAPAEDPKPPAAKVDSRPDLISAVVTARSQGSKVEVESMRTPTSTTWANPDGTMTTEAHVAPIRFKTADGSWRSVDLTLERGTDGMVAPKGHQFGLRLGKRYAVAGGVFASATAGAGRAVEWLAPWKLPEPTLAGTKATYAEIQPGIDLTLDARRSGFEADFIVKQRPADGVAPVWRIPLRTKGLTARQLEDGTIEFVDAKNVVRSRIPVGQMWDAVTDEHTKMPVNTAPVAMSLEQVSAGQATLVIAPDAKWFLDPARVFPVTVDPTYANVAVLPTFDTFVQSGWPNDLSTTTDLRVGKNGTTTERSFLNFAGSAFHGKDVISAHLSLMQWGATTCTATQMNLHASLPASTETRWTNMPVTSSTVWGSVSAAKGFSSACPADRVYVDMTGLAQYWSGQSDATVAVMLKAANETDANAWKRFYSSEGPADPYISLTWNRPPNAPATVETTEAVAYAAPGDTQSYMYSPSLRPWVRTKATDADGNTVKYIFEFMTGSNTVVGTCMSSVYASGTTAGCRPAADLPDNTLLYIRAKANDGRKDGPWTSYQTRLRIGAAAPAAPQISCPSPYVINSWQDNPPTADVQCTVTATGTGYNAPGYIRLTVDGQPYGGGTDGLAPGQVKITPSSDPAVAKATVTIDKDTAGLHRITATADTPALNPSPSSSYSFGWGGSAMTSPTVDPTVTTANTVRITASGPPKGQSSTVTAKVRWRTSGYGGSAYDTVGWTEDATALNVTDNGSAGVSVNQVWDTMNAKVDNSLDSDPNTAGIQPTTLNDRIPVKLDIQVCFTYASSSQCTWSQTPGTTVQRVPHAFGDGFPTSEAGPGQVALWTGEFNASATDVSVPGYTGDLSISRSHMTYETPTDQINGAFGQGWTAQFDGADAGAAGMQVIDQTRIDGTLVLLDGDGATLIYESPSGERRTTAAYEQGDWVPVDEDTSVDAARLAITGTGTSTVLSYVEDDGTVTTWKPAAPGGPSAEAATLFRADGISEAGVAGKTTFSYDGNGRIVRILAPPAPGVTCGAYVAGSPLSGLNPGCRALHFDYTTIGASRVRLSAAWLDIYNPDKIGGAGMESIQVAAYTYDTNALLTKVTDPRSGLATEYTYNASNHLASIKPAGQVPYQFNYVTADDREKLDTVTRARPAGDPTGGTAILGKYVYDNVPLSGPGVPDLSATAVAEWSQKAAPTKAVAVFGPDHPLTGAPTADDWQYADLQYTDAAGYTVNTAKYGAGNWQLTSTDYNDQGNVVRELDERALRQVIDNDVPADQLATITVYNPDIKNAAGDTVLTPAGTLVTDTYGPARWAALKNGSIAWVRPHTRTTYDQGAPNAGINPDTNVPYRLATTETSYAYDPGTGTDLEITGQTLTDYAAPVTGDADGWGKSLPSKTISDVDLNGSISTGDIVKVTRYDAEGRVIETRQPKSNGADAGTTKTVYYTTAANTTGSPECGSKPQWAGLVCKTFPAAAPSSGPSLPSTTTSAFTYLLAPKTVTETSGSVTRETATTYKPDGRTESTATTVTGLTGSTPNTKKTTTYDPATGQPTVVTATNADKTVASTITTGYDTWGRQVSYQPSGETATTTVYNAAGDVATITDANGSTTYTYDGTDANGKAERRGQVTKVDVTTAGSTWTSTGAYDSDGSMTVQKLPGGVTQHTDIDNAGEPIGLRYTGQVTTQNEDGSTTVDPNGGWLSWSIDNDVTGNVAREWTPDGAAFTGPAGGPPGDAIPYDRSYSYDNAGRLVTVKDRTASATGVDITDPTATPCVTRSYSFDANDNRLTKATASSGTDGICTTTGATTVTRAFDTADRPVTGANGSGDYVYDGLGRTTTLPASDAPKPADGDLTLAYYDNDLARSIAQGGSTTTFTLDAADRRAVETITSGSGTTQKVRHYADSGDNPTWVTVGTSSTRYAELIGGDLSLTVDQTGAADLTLANNHGDIVTMVDLPSAGAAASSIAGWNSYDEYGTAADSIDTGIIDYGWLGGKQRSTTAAGLVLMGVRLYNSGTGLFTSVDPVDGGGSNAYAYPTDPVNKFDLDGNRWCWRACRFLGEYARWRGVNDRYGVDLVALLPLGKVFKARKIAKALRHPRKSWRNFRSSCGGTRNCIIGAIGIATGVSDAWNGRSTWWSGQKRFGRFLRDSFNRGAARGAGKARRVVRYYRPRVERMYRRYCRWSWIC